MSHSARKLPSKADIQRRLSTLDHEIIDSHALLAKLDARLARTIDPKDRLRIVGKRAQAQARLTQQRSLGIKLRYLASKRVG